MWLGCVRPGICTCRSQVDIDYLILWLSTLFLEVGSLTQHGDHWLARPGGGLASSRDCLVSASHFWDDRCDLPWPTSLGSLHGSWESKFRPPRFHRILPTELSPLCQIPWTYIKFPGDTAVPGSEIEKHCPGPVVLSLKCIGEWLWELLMSSDWRCSLS